jgi:hypothetical protein
MDQNGVGKWSFFEQSEYRAIYLVYIGLLVLVIDYGRMLYLRWRMVTAPHISALPSVHH